MAFIDTGCQMDYFNNQNTHGIHQQRRTNANGNSASFTAHLSPMDVNCTGASGSQSLQNSTVIGYCNIPQAPGHSRETVQPGLLMTSSHQTAQYKGTNSITQKRELVQSSEMMGMRPVSDTTELQEFINTQLYLAPIDQEGTQQQLIVPLDSNAGVDIDETGARSFLSIPVKPVDTYAVALDESTSINKMPQYELDSFEKDGRQRNDDSCDLLQILARQSIRSTYIFMFNRAGAGDLKSLFKSLLIANAHIRTLKAYNELSQDQIFRVYATKWCGILVCVLPFIDLRKQEFSIFRDRGSKFIACEWQDRARRYILSINMNPKQRGDFLRLYLLDDIENILIGKISTELCREINKEKQQIYKGMLGSIENKQLFQKVTTGFMVAVKNSNEHEISRQFFGSLVEDKHVYLRAAFDCIDVGYTYEQFLVDFP